MKQKKQFFQLLVLSFVVTFIVTASLLLLSPANNEIGFSDLASSSSNYFDASIDFPNYLLPTPFRNKNLNEIPESVINKQKTLLEQAIFSVTNRMIVPVTQPDGSLKHERFLENAMKLVQEVDPDAEIYMAGGNVRSALAFIYKKIYDNEKKVPAINAETTLRQMITDQHDINWYDLKGVGSDLDLLVGRTNKPDAVKKILSSYINGALHTAFANERIDKKILGLLRTLFLQADIKSYDDQIQRSIAQGGSSLDWLVMDARNGKLRPPETDPNIVEDIISGYYTYFPAQATAEDPDTTSTIIRGMRPLFEIPFLRPKDPELLSRDLERVVQLLNSDQPVPERALDQLNKMSRNSMLGGAKNRIYRAALNSIDQIMNSISTLAKKKTKEQTYIPEFTDFIDRTDRQSLKPLPPEVILTQEEFFRMHTDHGILYHGTPTVETGLAILRQGLIISRVGQGNAGYGRGAYTTNKRSTADSYGKGGMVISFHVRSDYPAKVVDWKKLEGTPLFAELERQAQDRNVDINTILATDYGVDVIINGHVLIQNANIISHEVDIKNLMTELATSRLQNLVPLGNPRFTTSLEAALSALKLSLAAKALTGHAPEGYEEKIVHIMNQDLEMVVNDSNNGTVRDKVAYLKSVLDFLETIHHPYHSSLNTIIQKLKKKLVDQRLESMTKEGGSWEYGVDSINYFEWIFRQLEEEGVPNLNTKAELSQIRRKLIESSFSARPAIFVLRFPKIMELLTTDEKKLYASRIQEILLAASVNTPTGQGLNLMPQVEKPILDWMDTYAQWPEASKVFVPMLKSQLTTSRSAAFKYLSTKPLTPEALEGVLTYVEKNTPFLINYAYKDIVSLIKHLGNYQALSPSQRTRLEKVIGSNYLLRNIPVNVGSGLMCKDTLLHK